MWKKILPDEFQKSVLDINPLDLKNKGFKLVLLDIDNTIAKYEDAEPDEATKKWVNSVKDVGLAVCVFSNNRPRRVHTFGEHLKTKSFPLSTKPFKRQYKAIIREFSVPAEEICAIGDQLFMDVLGAKRMGIYVILVDRIYDTGTFIRKWVTTFEDKVRLKYRPQESAGDL